MPQTRIKEWRSDGDSTHRPNVVVWGKCHNAHGNFHGKNPHWAHTCELLRRGGHKRGKMVETGEINGRIQQLREQNQRGHGEKWRAGNYAQWVTRGVQSRSQFLSRRRRNYRSIILTNYKRTRPRPNAVGVSRLLTSRRWGINHAVFKKLQTTGLIPMCLYRSGSGKPHHRPPHEQTCANRGLAG